MKNLMKILGSLTLVLSVVTFLYGSIKLVRLEEKGSQSIETNIRGVKVIPPDSKLPMKIFGFSTLLFVVGVSALIMSSKMDNSRNSPEDLPKEESNNQEAVTPDQSDQSHE